MGRLAVIGRLAVLAAALLTAVSSHAQETLLRLADTATLLVVPDELAAAMRAEAPAPTAREAQGHVNEMMRDAIATAKKIEGIEVSTGAYNVWHVPPSVLDRSDHWQAAQALNLRGKDAEAMQKLVGDLQQKGLSQLSLNWRLSRQSEQDASKAATKQALTGLRGRADEAAEILGLKFASFKEVRLDNVMPPPILPRTQIVTRAISMGAAPAPSAEAEDLPVTARAEADIVLVPR